jgi:hypothetical protein
MLASATSARRRAALARTAARAGDRRRAGARQVVDLEVEALVLVDDQLGLRVGQRLGAGMSTFGVMSKIVGSTRPVTRTRSPPWEISPW